MIFGPMINEINKAVIVAAAEFKPKILIAGASVYPRDLIMQDSVRLLIVLAPI